MKISDVKKNKLIKLASSIRKARALVVGDLILDKYIWGSASRLSPEAPVPVVWANKENNLLGGSSNVANNVVAMKAKASVCGLVGNDFYGNKLKSLLKNKGISCDMVLTDKTRPTTLKTRVIASRQQVVRVDWESCEPVSLKVNQRLVSLVKKNIHKFDVVIIEDYGKGVINPDLIEEVVELGKRYKKIITVDPKEEHFDYYQGVTALTPNLSEAQSASGLKVRRPEDLDLVAETIIEKIKPQALLVTLGDKGMRLFLKSGESIHIPVTSLEVFDVSGAGDTVIAVFSLALASGASFLEAASLANYAAGIVVGRLGVAVTNPAELKQVLQRKFRKA